MDEITTPGQVISELNRLMDEMGKGVKALYEAEVRMVELDTAYERKLALAILESTGPAIERNAVAKLAASEEKLALDLAKAQLNRVKAKMRSIDSAQVAVSVIGRQVELTWRHS